MELHLKNGEVLLDIGFFADNASDVAKKMSELEQLFIKVNGKESVVIYTDAISFYRIFEDL